MLDDAWPLVLFGLRIGMAAALYLFLFVAIRALRAEVRARTMPLTVSARPSAVRSAAAGTAEVPTARRAAPAYAASPALAPAQDRLDVVGMEADGSTEEAARVTGRSFALRGPVLIGRATSNSIVLPERHVSSRHARLIPGEGGWWVEDLGSTNGTFVGAQRVSGRVRVAPDAELRFGPVVARLVAGAGSAAS